MLGVEPTAKIGVCGDSAGGMISASLAKTLQGIDFQVLILIDFVAKSFLHLDSNLSSC